MAEGMEELLYKYINSYVNFSYNPQTEIHVYEVSFLPEIKFNFEREGNLEEHAELIGHIRTFDCKILFLKNKLKDTITTLMSSNGKIETKLTYIRTETVDSNEQFWLAIVHYIAKELDYKRINSNYYKPSAYTLSPEYINNEIWPGFEASVDNLKYGLILRLNFDAIDVNRFKVCEHFERINKVNPTQYKDVIKKQLDKYLGYDVLIKGDNIMAYRIKDVKISQHPKESGENELKASLLVKDDTEATYYIQPDNCQFFTPYNKMLRPEGQFECVENFPQHANANKNVKLVLDSWGLKLLENQKIVSGRWLGDEIIYFGKNEKSNADQWFSYEQYQVLAPENIRHWLLVHCKKNSTEAKTFVEEYVATAKSIGIHVDPEPDIEELDEDDTGSYLNGLRRNLEHFSYQLVIVIFPSVMEERYVTLKKLLCSEFPTPSKFIDAGSFNSNTNSDWFLKLAQNINCKLGGALWKVKIPMDDLMVCGVHVTEIPRGRPVYALVASSNSQLTKWFSKALVTDMEEEFDNALSVLFQSALMKYKAKNEKFPERLILFRNHTDKDDEEQQALHKDEWLQIKKACHQLDPTYKPNLTYITVDTTLAGNENTCPGHVVRFTCADGKNSEYFLWSHQDETVPPTLYSISNNIGTLDFNLLESLTYKLCLLDYEKADAVRVPACCTYAEKLASFVATKIQLQPSGKLCDKFFYL